jgi:protein MpaA
MRPLAACVFVAAASTLAYSAIADDGSSRVSPVPRSVASVAPSDRQAKRSRVGLRSAVARIRPGRLLGRSARGRRIEVTAFGNAHARPRLLVVGCIHGTECAGRAIVRRLTRGCPPLHADVWAVDNLNPDGFALGTRLNGRGVDLNRNFPSGWRPNGQRRDLEYSGPRPGSEPETRAAMRLVGRLRPDVTIWFHQQAQPLVRAWGGSVPAARRFARIARLPFHRLPWIAGTAPNWQNHAFHGASSFVVELPPGSLDRTQAARYAAAIETLAGYRGESRTAIEGSRKHHPRGRLVLARRPYMGVACRIPNSIACDRVGLAVYIPKRRSAVRLEASIAGRPVKMAIPDAVPTKGIYFQGFLHPAGLRSGPLKVTPDRPVFATVRITAHYRDGTSRSTTRRVGLAPGWG